MTSTDQKPTHVVIAKWAAPTPTLWSLRNPAPPLALILGSGVLAFAIWMPWTNGSPFIDTGLPPEILKLLIFSAMVLVGYSATRIWSIPRVSRYDIWLVGLCLAPAFLMPGHGYIWMALDRFDSAYLSSFAERLGSAREAHGPILPLALAGQILGSWLAHRRRHLLPGTG